MRPFPREKKENIFINDFILCCVDSIVKALQEHHKQQTSERKKLYKNQNKCYDNPNKYLGLIIDGMDQKKTLLPHFFRTPKNLQEGNFIQYHLVGCMVFNGKMLPWVYFTAPNIHSDANMTITIIHDVISHWFGNILEFLYLQLDNTCCENKNPFLFGYLNMILELIFFSEGKGWFPSFWAHS